LLSVNKEKVEDIIQYRFLISEEYIELEIQKQKNGKIYLYEIEKDYDEELGIEFTNPIIDKAKSCRNKCVFCFIDQLPKGMRETLYFKDDDSRLSFLQGNFVTLTNMSEDDVNNIIRYRISPINISV
ncbi:radical SAM protein, partial [Clostridium perfringens]|nr:radical SAM protein [Clostridium perfringens]